MIQEGSELTIKNNAEEEQGFYQDFNNSHGGIYIKNGGTLIIDNIKTNYYIKTNVFIEEGASFIVKDSSVTISKLVNYGIISTEGKIGRATGRERVR